MIPDRITEDHTTTVSLGISQNDPAVNQVRKNIEAALETWHATGMGGEEWGEVEGGADKFPDYYDNNSRQHSEI